MLARWFADREALWVRLVVLWSQAQQGCRRLESLEPYEPCRVAGVVTRVRVDPSWSTIEAVVTDGTGFLVARWEGRRSLSELKVSPRTGLVLDGVVRRGHGDLLVMVEPAFEVLAGPGGM